MAPIIPKSGNTKLSTAANLANLLPTGTALAFQGLIPYFTNNGSSCQPVHKYLTASAIIIFSLVCLISSFTDSFIATNGKLYYGIATFKGLLIFNKDDNDDNNENDTNSNKIEENNPAEHNQGGEISVHNEERGDLRKKLLETSAKDDEDEKIILAYKLAKYRIQLIDFVHAFFTWLVFVVYATCSSDVQRCYSPHPSDTANVLTMNLPLGVGLGVSTLFMLFPTKRRGIGFADVETFKNEA